MEEPNKKVFLQLWPICFINFMGVIEVIAIIILVLTELGNVAANFWVTNVFAGGWCALVILIHVVLLFISGCCSPGPEPAFRATVVAVVGLVASAAMISFDAAFVAQPSTCILTSECLKNSVSNTTFSYNFRLSFFTVFNSWSPFKSYQQNQVKFLCQTIQLGIGALCFITCILYIIIYYVCSSKSKPQIHPMPQQPVEPFVQQQQGYYPPPQQQSYYQTPPPAQQGYYGPPSAPVQQNMYPPPVQQNMYPPPVQPQYYQPPPPAWGPPPRVPQAAPGVIPWGGYRRY